MCAMLIASSAELTRPTYSSISFGFVPAAVIRLGEVMWVGTGRSVPAPAADI
jgi:hypothetical protein